MAILGAFLGVFVAGMAAQWLIQSREAPLKQGEAYYWTLESGGVVLVCVSMDSNGRAVVEVIQEQLFEDARIRMRSVKFGRARRMR